MTHYQSTTKGIEAVMFYQNDKINSTIDFSGDILQ